MSPRAHTETGLGFEGAKRLLGALRDPDPAAHPPPPHASGDPSAPAGAAGFPSIPAYRFVARLGSGGSGTVFKVFRDGSDRPLALKLLAHASAGPADSAQRAFRELDFLETLRLPCVPRLIDYGTHEGRLFFVTDLVPGTSLADLPPPDSSDLRTRVELLARVADAVALLHDRAVLHRDLKPSNVIADPSGQPVIIDLGLAHALNSGLASLTQTGVPLGTPAFMSPEAARGDHRLLSIRTDVFGLGAIGYWLLTGQPPHSPDASIHGAIRRAAEQPVRNPLEAAPTLPIPLSLVLQKACAVRIEHRYATAADFAADLRRYLSGERVLAQPPSLWQHALRWVGRHPVGTTAILGAVIIACSVLLAWGAVWWVSERPHRFAIVAGDEHNSWGVALQSAAGRELAFLGSRDNTGHVILHELVDLPVTLRGPGDPSRVAVICVHGARPAGDTAGEIWVCDPGNLGRPLYASAGDPPDIPPIPAPYDTEETRSEFQREKFRVNSALITDVFPELPGPELVAVFNCANTPSVVRVLSLRCEVLFEAWHFGSLYQAVYNAQSGLLLVCGNRHGKRSHTWSALGIRARYDYPRVVVALRPTCGARYGWLDDCRLANRDGPLVFYEAVWGPEPSDLFTLGIQPPARSGDGTEIAQVVLKCRGSEGPDAPPQAPTRAWRGGWNVLIDATGRAIPGTVELSDGFLANFAQDAWAARRFVEGYRLVAFPSDVPGARVPPAPSPR